MSHSVDLCDIHTIHSVKALCGVTMLCETITQDDRTPRRGRGRRNICKSMNAAEGMQSNNLIKSSSAIFSLNHIMLLDQWLESKIQKKNLLIRAKLGGE